MDAQRKVIRRVSAEDIRPLRHSVLRPGQEYLETRYSGDDAGVHFGAFDGDRLVGIASLYEENRVGGPAGGWRLRGMATDPVVRGAGFGASLLAACLDYVADAGGTEVWCNARTVAAGFYRRAGFEVVSEEFDVPGIGGHVAMVKAVPG